MPCTGSLSRREGVCNARPQRCAACAWLLPAPRSSGRGQGLHHPLREVPEQGQKLTLGHRGNLQSENTDAYGAKWRVRLSALDSAPGGLPSSPASRGGGQPQTRTPTACWFRGEERLTCHYPDQLEHPAQVHNKDFVTFGVGRKNPSLLPAGHYKSRLLRLELLHEGKAAARYMPYTCVPGSTGHVRILPEKKHRS